MKLLSSQTLALLELVEPLFMLTILEAGITVPESVTNEVGTLGGKLPAVTPFIIWLITYLLVDDKGV